jgi:hypothetical protein
MIEHEAAAAATAEIRGGFDVDMRLAGASVPTYVPGAVLPVSDLHA